MKKVNAKNEVTELGMKSSDVLESAEMVRASNVLLRAAIGVSSMTNQICKSEVISDDRAKEVQPMIDKVFELLRDVYASLMSRYSALENHVGEDVKISN